jgi:hypothetical protein
MFSTAVDEAGTDKRYLRASIYHIESGSGHDTRSNIRIRKQIWNGSSYINYAVCAIRDISGYL